MVQFADCCDSCHFSPVEIDSDSDVEEYEDAMNADDDIFAEPVQQNRLKTLSKFTSLSFYITSLTFIIFPDS